MICGSEITRLQKHGVAIDTRVVGGGVWLDKGEPGELMVGVNQAGSSTDQVLSWEHK